MIGKTAQGSWRVRVKSHGVVVADRTFSRKGDASRWEADQKRRLQSGDWIDPKAGQEQVGSVIARWIAIRQHTVKPKTFQTDELLTRIHISQKMRRRPLASVRTSDIEQILVDAGTSLRRSSLIRFKATLSSFFAWSVRERIVESNPVLGARIPNGRAAASHEVFPFTIDELRSLHADLKLRGGKWADLALVFGFSGIRWGEMRALRVRDYQERSLHPVLYVSRSAPDGQAEINDTTKSGRARSIPLPDELVPVFRSWIEDKRPDDLIFSNAAGHRTNRSNWTRQVQWKQHCRRRQIRDLRHTAATLWLSNGIDPKTVQTWLGHASMTLTVDLYSHYMGTDADAAAITKFNAVLRSHRGDEMGTT